MTGFRLALPVTLALIVVMLTGAGAAAAQEQSQSLAPSNLSVEICGGSACLSWMRGADDYIFQEIQYWENLDGQQTGMGRWIASEDASEAEIPLIFLNLRKRTIYEDGSRSYTFQVAGVKGSFFNRVYSGYSNRASLYVSPPGMEPVDEQPPQTPEESENPAAKTKPSGLTATQDGGTVILNWTPGHNPNYVRQVVLRREAVQGTELEVIHTFTREANEMDVDTYTDATAQAGKRYVYRIKALKANGKGAMTNAAKITVQ